MPDHAVPALTIEAVAEMLGIGDEWTTVLDVPPNTALTLEQVKRLANVALVRGVMKTENEMLAELFGAPAPEPPTFLEAADVFDRARAEQEGDGSV